MYSLILNRTLEQYTLCLFFLRIDYGTLDYMLILSSTYCLVVTEVGSTLEPRIWL